jgi:ankyrin repeat protein
MLLNNGADVNAGSEERNAIQAAAEQGYEGIVRLLLEAGATVHADGGAIKAAERKGYKRILAILRKEAKS